MEADRQKDREGGSLVVMSHGETAEAVQQQALHIFSYYSLVFWHSVSHSVFIALNHICHNLIAYFHMGKLPERGHVFSQLHQLTLYLLK